MPNPMIRIHNTKTNEIIDREMNAKEFAQYKLEQEEFAKSLLEQENAAKAKAALLERLGITAEEAALLLG
jgi:hypothetical protein